MLVMTSRCFDRLLQHAVTAPALSKPNPADGRHQVPAVGARSPWHGIARLPVNTRRPLLMEKLLEPAPISGP